MSRETPAPGVVVFQPRRGFRYAADAFWLAGFALEGGRARTVVDLGTGSGIVALLLAGRGLDVVGVDVRPEWRPCWEASLSASDVRCRFIQDDVASWRGGPVDLVVANPPYFPAGSGPVAADPLRAAARMETTAGLADFVAAALAMADRACFVLPSEREPVALAAAREEGAGAVRRVRVGRRRVLLELRPGAPGADPVQVHEDHPRVRRWYRSITGASEAQDDLA